MITKPKTIPFYKLHLCPITLGDHLKNSASKKLKTNVRQLRKQYFK